CLDRFPARLSYCLRLLIGFNAVDVGHGRRLSAMGGMRPLVIVEGACTRGKPACRKRRCPKLDRILQPPPPTQGPWRPTAGSALLTANRTNATRSAGADQ